MCLLHKPTGKVLLIIITLLICTSFKFVRLFATITWFDNHYATSFKAFVYTIAYPPRIIHAIKAMLQVANAFNTTDNVGRANSLIHAFSSFEHHDKSQCPRNPINMSRPSMEPAYRVEINSKDVARFFGTNVVRAKGAR